MSSKLSQLFELAVDITRLPVARLEFRLAMNPDDVRRMHAYFTKRHPKYKVFKNKALGAALVNVRRYGDRGAYLDSIKDGGRNSAEHFARKAKSRGYVLTEIDRNKFVDDIYEINNSVDMRQGRPMDEAYRRKETSYVHEKNYRHFGVLNPAGKLVAYSDLGFYGNFAAFNRVIGIRNNDGIMHLMLSEIISELIDKRSHDYVMYDTYFGASPGLKTFKTMLGFEPYRAKYSLQ